MKQAMISKIKEYRIKNPKLNYLSDIEIIYNMEYWGKVQHKCKHMKSAYKENTLCVLCGVHL